MFPDPYAIKPLGWDDGDDGKVGCTICWYSLEEKVLLELV
jgi:hypothetical protein